MRVAKSFHVLEKDFVMDFRINYNSTEFPSKQQYLNDSTRFVQNSLCTENTISPNDLWAI